MLSTIRLWSVRNLANSTALLTRGVSTSPGYQLMTDAEIEEDVAFQRVKVMTV